MHLSCLEQKIIRDRRDEPSIKCYTCGENYKISVQFRFKFEKDRCMSGRSVGHIFEIFMLIVMMACFSLVCWMNFSHQLKIEADHDKHPHHRDHVSKTSQVILGIMCLLTLASVPLTIHRIYTRYVDTHVEHTYHFYIVRLRTMITHAKCILFIIILMSKPVALSSLISYIYIYILLVCICLILLSC